LSHVSKSYASDDLPLTDKLERIIPPLKINYEERFGNYDVEHVCVAKVLH
jgi:hypothetical protein